MESREREKERGNFRCAVAAAAVYCVYIADSFAVGNFTSLLALLDTLCNFCVNTHHRYTHDDSSAIAIAMDDGTYSVRWCLMCALAPDFTPLIREHHNDTLLCAHVPVESSFSGMLAIFPTDVPRTGCAAHKLRYTNRLATYVGRSQAIKDGVETKLKY